MADRTLIPADAEVWRRTGQAVPDCTADVCKQGRAPCPCPEACEVPESERDPELTRIVWGTYAAVILAILGAVFWPHH